MIAKLDKKYMERCFELAKKGSGKVSPNPLVGSVIVKNKTVISEGWHKEFGKDHAEAMAIKNAKEDLSGAILYCNLEPCIHTNKKTPPCCPAIIQSGITRVVISNIDPNPSVAGKSIQQMKNAGIQVETGVMEEEGKELNRFFFKHIKEKEPWVTLKIAQSIDGKISLCSEIQTWLTGTESKKYVHQLRAEYDAILVGSNTINVDNPQLNVRYIKGRNPLKIILAGKLNLNPNSKIFQLDDKNLPWVFCDEKLIKSSRVKFRKGVRLIGCPLNENEQISLRFILNFLYKEQVGSLLVEGGQNIYTQFLKNNFCDELIILQAPIILGDGLQSVKLNSKKDYNLKSVNQLGSDLCLNLRKKETN